MPKVSRPANTPSPLFVPPKGARKGVRTRLKILESAFQCISRDGYYRTTFQTIADRAGVSQPLVVRAFSNRDGIFLAVAHHLLELAIVNTESRLAAASPATPLERVKTYFDVSIDMLSEQPDLARFYMNTYYLSTYERAVRALNSQVRARAVERLTNLLAGASKLRRRLEVAQSLHDYLIGFLLNTIASGTKWDRAAIHRTLTYVFLSRLKQ